jgi:hypothetical protein
MLARVPGSPESASIPSVTSDAQILFDGRNDADQEDQWFRAACRGLLPHKAGTALHFATGFDERTCQRYAAGHVRPPAYFLRCLLRSEDGWQWLNVIMDGATAAWWLEAKSAKTRLAECEATLQSLLQSIQQQLNH